MTTEIIIATRNRFEKLCKTIDSIDLNKFRIKVRFDGDIDGYAKFNKKYRSLRDVKNIKFGDSEALYKSNITSLHGDWHAGAVSCRNSILSLTARNRENNIIYATDDIIFKPESIETAEIEFKKHFPDNDGVLGFRQTGNNKYHPTGMAMVGINFLKKYPNQWLFYPGYFHFACQEVLWHAEKINKFQVGSEKVTIEHFNPMINKEYMDQTHKDARIHKVKDHKLILERAKKGLIWGYNDFKI